MGRREQREQIFKLLFRVEFNQKEEMPEQCALFFEDEENGIPEKDIAYIQGKFDKIQEKLPEIDEMINTTARGWTTSRMGKVDLTIIRLAVYEIKFDEEVPDSVAINEAVELAKKFGQEESSGFVNGVLARFVSRKPSEKCIYCSAGEVLYQEHVFTGFHAAEYLCQGRSEQLQVSFFRAYLFYNQGCQGHDCLRHVCGKPQRP